MSTDVRGRIAIDVQFWDRTSAEGVQSLKTIALQDSTEYTSGKVAVVSGTCGTAIVTLSTNLFSEDSAGQPVEFATINRIAIRGNPLVFLASGFTRFGMSKDNQIAIVSNPLNNNLVTPLQVGSLSGTASYTLVIYGT